MNALFEALYFLQKDSFYKKIYYASRAYSSLVTAQIVLNSQFPWSRSLTTWLQNILLWLSIPVQNATQTQFYWLLAITSAVIFLCAGLYYYVCFQIHSGTMGSHRVTKALRFLLGILVTLSNPVLSILLESVDCDWIGGSNLSLLWDLTESCTSHLPRIVLMCVSAVTFVPFVVLVVLSSIMHVSDPKSSMILSRAHSRVDLASVVADTISNALFVFLTGHDGLLAAIYIALQLAVVVSFVVFQPYYHAFSNDLFTMFAAQTLWAGVSFGVLAATSDGGHMASIVLYAGVVPVGGAAFWASSYWRGLVIRQALEEHDPSPDDEVEIELADDRVFPVLREKYDRNSTTFFVTDMKAALVEVQTRFLLADSSPRAMAIAENIYKRGLLKYPQSVYLRLQYVTFLLYFRDNAALASVRLDEISSLEIDLDMRFSVLRKKREVERKRHVGQMGNSALGMDSISFEEVKTRIKDVRGLHKKAIELTEQLWKTLSRKLGGGGRKQRATARRLMRQALSRRVHPEEQMEGVSPGTLEGGLAGRKTAVSEAEILAAIAPIVEELQRVTDQADAEYAILWAQCGDSREVGAEYARYLRNIKKDGAAADEIEDRLQIAGGRGGGGSQSGGDNNSRDGASSQGSAALTVEQQQQRQKLTAMTTSFTERVSALRLRLRTATVLLVVAAVCSFSVFYVMTSRAIPIYLSLFEIGQKRFSCVISAHELRQMHLSALQGDLAGFNTTRSYLNSSMLFTRDVHYGLSVTYRTDFALRNDFVGDQSINVRRVGSANKIVAEKLSPDELLMRMVDYTLEAIAQPASKFATTFAANLAQFPQFFFVLENSFNCAKAMDTIGEMYRLEMNQILGYASATLIAMLVVIVIIELVTVVLLFRPAVNRAFDDLAVCVARFIRVPLETSKELATLETKHLARFRVLAGDDQSSVMMEEDLEAPGGEGQLLRSSPRRVRVNMSPRGSQGFAGLVSPRGSMGLVSPRNEDASIMMSGDDLGLLSPTMAFRQREDSTTSTLFTDIPGVPTANDAQRPEDILIGADRGIPLFPKRSAIKLTESAPSSPLQNQLTLGVEVENVDQQENGEIIYKFQAPKVPRLVLTKNDEPPPSAPSLTHEDRRNSDQTEVSEFADADTDDEREPTHRSKARTLLARLVSIFLLRGKRDSKDTSRRKLPIVITYTLMLLVISICIAVVTALGTQAINHIVESAPNVINSVRRRYLFLFSYLFASEIYFSRTPLSLVGSALSGWSEKELGSRVVASASLGLMMHYGVLYGTNEGIAVLPASRNLLSLDSIVTSPYSPVTADLDLFYSSIQMKGIATDPLYSSFYFVPQCPTTNDFAPNSVQMTYPRITRFTKSLTPSGCPLYKSGQATSGFHRLVDSSFTTCFEITKTNLSSPVETAILLNNVAQVIVLQDPNTDLLLGLTKVVLIALGSSIDLITTNQTIMAGVFAVIVSAIALQYVVLGKRIQLLMKTNLSMTLTCERLLENAVAVMKKQGYTSAEIKKLINNEAPVGQMVGPREMGTMDSDAEMGTTEEMDLVALPGSAL